MAEAERLLHKGGAESLTYEAHTSPLPWEITLYRLYTKKHTDRIQGSNAGLLCIRQTCTPMQI